MQRLLQKVENRARFLTSPVCIENLNLNPKTLEKTAYFLFLYLESTKKSTKNENFLWKG